MPESRFLKKHKKNYKEIENYRSLPPQRVSSEHGTKRADAFTVAMTTERLKTNNDVNGKLSKSKDKEFIDRMTKRLNTLTQSLSPSAVSSARSTRLRSSIRRAAPVNQSIRRTLVPLTSVVLYKVHRPVDFPLNRDLEEPGKFLTPRSPVGRRNLDGPRILTLGPWDLDRPRSEGYFSVSKAEGYGDIRAHLIQRQSQTVPEPPSSSQIHSLWTLVRAERDVDLPLRWTRRQELDDFSNCIGRFVIPEPSTGYSSDGSDYWRRLASIKSDLVKMEQQASHVFGTIFHCWSVPWSSETPEFDRFSPAEVAIRWAQERRRNLLNM